MSWCWFCRPGKVLMAGLGKIRGKKHGEIQTYLLTACWIWRIQTFLFSLEVEWNSYITGGEESIMRNIPRSWLAISRTIRFWRDSTAGLSWTTEERNNRDTAEWFWVRGPFVFIDCLKSVWIDFCDKFNTDPNFKTSTFINAVTCSMCFAYQAWKDAPLVFLLQKHQDVCHQ